MITFPAFAEHHHFTGHNFDTGMLGPFCVFPTAGLKATFNVNLLAFGQVLFADLSQVTPGDHIKPFCFCMPLAVSGVPTAAGGYCKGGYGPAGWV
jgi:hypothetical protein